MEYYLSHLLNVVEGNDVRQTAVLKTEQSLGPEPSPSGVETAIEKYKLPGTYQIPVDLIQAGGNSLRCEIHPQT
jgi:hypothetical protein